MDDSIAEGHLLLAEGQVARAVPLLRKTTTAGGPSERGAELLAEALSRQGNHTEPIATLQSVWASVRMFEQRVNPRGSFWMRDDIALARLQRATGDVAAARQTEQRLAALFAATEPGFPLLWNYSGSAPSDATWSYLNLTTPRPFVPSRVIVSVPMLTIRLFNLWPSSAFTETFCEHSYPNSPQENKRA
ncbi:hypothetical protein BH18ACI5_BH18ACI5_16980 [soil metagenome]